MKDFRYGNPELFEAFVKSAQYIVSLKAQQDIWDHLGKFILTYFPADWTALVRRDSVKGIAILHCTLPEAIAAERILTDEARSLIADVLESGFLASGVIPAPGPSMTAYLPIVEESRTVKVMLIGHKSSDPLPRELLNIYLAVAGLAGTTFERLNNERELNRHRAHLEDLVKERTVELEAANRELEAFSYSVSHDLRSPLRSITGFSQVLVEDYSEMLDEEGKDAVGRIQAATLKMGQIIDDLLNLSRVSRSELRRDKVNLTALAKKIADEFLTGEPGRKAEFVIAPSLAAHGDPRLLRIVLQNLLGNAWKFTANQEAARIEFGALECGITETAGMTNIGRSQMEGKIAYFVRDNGAGFDPAYANKLFAPFQRLHAVDDFPGTGIGLATVQRIIRRHGGEVWAEGKINEGATFYFTLDEVK